MSTAPVRPAETLRSSSLANRTEQAVFLRFLKEEMARVEQSGTSLGLVLVRLRGLKRLNASLGYEGGNRALMELAARLRGGFSGRARVLRVGARKFALVLPGLKGEPHAWLAAQKVQRLVEAPLAIDGQQVVLVVAQGIALYPEHADSPAQLLHSAETALSRTGDQEDSISVYDRGGRTQILQSLRVEGALLDALSQGGIQPHFQPLVELATGRTIGGEALLRCGDGKGGFLRPEAVIESAQRLQRLDEVTATMINASLRRAAEWARAGRRLNVAVNIDPSSLRRQELIAIVEEALGTWEVDAGTLTLEITENVFIADPDKSFETMRRLCALGVRVAIDDFGTGYSSLAYFRDIPAAELKIDKSFVTNMRGDAANRKIVRAVIELARAFDLQTVAEGVEDEATAQALLDMGCEVAQGYWFSPPLEAPRFWSWIRDRDGGPEDGRAR